MHLSRWGGIFSTLLAPGSGDKKIRKILDFACRELDFRDVRRVGLVRHRFHDEFGRGRGILRSCARAALGAGRPTTSVKIFARSADRLKPGLRRTILRHSCWSTAFRRNPGSDGGPAEAGTPTLESIDCRGNCGSERCSPRWSPDPAAGRTDVSLTPTAGWPGRETLPQRSAACPMQVTG